MGKASVLIRILLAMMCVLGILGLAAAQDAPATVPTDPKALLLAAASANGAPGPDAKPWHIKISFTLKDLYGKPESQGTFEEFWAAPDKIKRIYETSSFQQVEYITPDGVRRTGAIDGAPPELERVVNEFLHPIALDATSAEQTQLKMHSIKKPNTKLACVSANRAGSANVTPMDVTYCLEESLPILRMVIEFGGSKNTVRNSITQFQNRYFPRSVEKAWISPNREKVAPGLTATLETLEVINAVDESQFTPPADASLAPSLISLDEKETKSQLDKNDAPIYPPIAKAAHVYGDVVIALQIRTDGRVSDLRILSGPAMLQLAAFDSVKKWTYKPFVQNGHPVVVNTTVTVPFRLKP